MICPLRMGDNEVGSWSVFRVLLAYCELGVIDAVKMESVRLSRCSLKLLLFKSFYIEVLLLFCRLL